MFQGLSSCRKLVAWHTVNSSLMQENLHLILQVFFLKEIVFINANGWTMVFKFSA
uniref:Uncharacterized protein n=1 Tax=Setaria italica TaxID=4555 RepID=K3ZGA3_SETIT